MLDFLKYTSKTGTITDGTHPPHSRCLARLKLLVKAWVVPPGLCAQYGVHIMRISAIGVVSYLKSNQKFLPVTKKEQCRVSHGATRHRLPLLPNICCTVRCIDATSIHSQKYLKSKAVLRSYGTQGFSYYSAKPALGATHATQRFGNESTQI